jgi:hypothetical protein
MGTRVDSIDQKTKNRLEDLEGGPASYDWRTGNQFGRGYKSKCKNDKKRGPTIEFELEKAPANGEVIGHVWLPDGVRQCDPDFDDVITLILKDNHASEKNKNEFQYKIRVPYNNDDGDSLFWKEFKHHKYQPIERIDYKFRPVAKGGCTIGMKAVWFDTKNGVMIKFYVDEGEEQTIEGGKKIRDSWRPKKEEHEKHLDEEWEENEDLPDFFYNGNPTNNWRLVFEHEDTETDKKGHGPYKGETGVQTAFRIDAKGRGKVKDRTHKNRPILYGALVREINAPS